MSLPALSSKGCNVAGHAVLVNEGLSASFASASASTQHPEGGSAGVGDQHAAGLQRRLDATVRLVMRDGDVEVDAVALRARLGHLLEPDRLEPDRRALPDRGLGTR